MNSTESFDLFEWMVEHFGDLPPFVLGLMAFILVASVAVILLSIFILLFDKVRWAFDIEIKLLNNPVIRISKLGETLSAMIILLTFRDTVEVVDIKARIIKDGIDGLGDNVSLDLMKIEKINKNIQTDKIEQYTYTSALDILPSSSTSRQKLEFSIINGENKVKNELDIFKMKIYDLLKQTEYGIVQNGKILNPNFRNQLFDLKYDSIEGILNALHIVDGNYKLHIDVQYRLIDRMARKSKDIYTSTQEVNFKVVNIKELIRIELDNMLSTIMLNMMSSPAKPVKVKYPEFVTTSK